MKFPKCETHVPYNLGNNPEQEWVIKSIEDHCWSPTLQFKVLWEFGDSTWEPLKIVNNLKALDEYLELEGVNGPLAL